MDVTWLSPISFKMQAVYMHSINTLYKEKYEKRWLAKRYEAKERSVVQSIQ